MTDPSTDAPSTTRHLHLGWALVLISVAQLMVVLDSTIANIALPYIQADLGFSDAGLTWVVTTYALAFGGLLLLGGRLGDLYGRRLTFMVGLSVFAVASLLGGVAESEAMLLGARALQGAGAALASPAALALITTTFPAGPQRNRAFAVYAGMSGAGAAVGLILGGWLTGSTLSLLGTTIDGWRLTFLINVPIGIVAAALAPRVLAESETHKGELDVPGAITATFGLFGIVYGLSRASSHGWSDTWTVASLVVGAGLLVLFALIESRATHPLLPFRIFRNRTRASSFAAMMLMPAGMFAMFFYLSLYVQNVMGFSPLEAGVAFLPFTAGIVVAAMVASNLVSRMPPRYLAGTGTLMASIALVGFSRIPYDTTYPVSDLTASYATQILPWMILMSLGMGLTFVPLTLTAVHHVQSRDSGIGSGVLNTMQQVGGALGLATLATVAQHVWRTSGEALAKSAAEAAANAPAGTPVPSEAERQAMAAVAQNQVFADGASTAFLIGAVIILMASAVVWLFLNVTHDELAQDAQEHPEQGVHVV
ncbi:MAG TPA: MFS transporter [Nocardioides sp.]|uniref:MFS transporter n=1 Tax=Nocardioides sp. TaxID=35761 RepID=UPI002CA6CE96|nr:MFS transporter [Nocardioides sp.]HQR26629.1 MFS transporter [Nocardioides sp.]